MISYKGVAMSSGDNGDYVYRIVEMNPGIGEEIFFGNCMGVQINLLKYLGEIGPHSGGFVVNHEGIKRADCSWAASLVKGLELAKRRKIHFYLSNLSPKVRHMLAINKLEILF